MGLTALPWWHLRQSSGCGLLLTLTIPFWVQICFLGGMSFWLSSEQSNTVSQRLGLQLRQEIALRAWQIVGSNLQNNVRKAGERGDNAAESAAADQGHKNKNTNLLQIIPSFQDLSADLPVSRRGAVVVFDPEQYAPQTAAGDYQVNDLTLSTMNYVKQQLPLGTLKYQQNLIFERNHQKYHVVVRPYMPQSHEVARLDFHDTNAVKFNQSLQRLLVVVVMPEDEFLANVPPFRAIALWFGGLVLSLVWVWLVSQWLLKAIRQITWDCQQITQEITAQTTHGNFNFSHVKLFHLKKSQFSAQSFSSRADRNDRKSYFLHKKPVNYLHRSRLSLVTLDTLQAKFPFFALISSRRFNPVNELQAQWHYCLREIQEHLHHRQQSLDTLGHHLMLARQETLAVQSWLRADSVRTGAEIKIARQIQKMLLPTQAEMTIHGLDIAAYMQPMDEIGGDYYDVLQTPAGVTFAIGDVTGHGLESGIVMLMTQTAVRTLTEINQRNIKEFFNAINRTLYYNIKRMDSDKCLSLTILNYDQGKLTISGQHEDILVVRRNGIIERVDTFDLGFPIGLEPDISQFIKHVSIYLQPGDGVVLYTDGITEAQNLAKEFYGIEHLCNLVQKHWQASAHAIQKIVITDVAEYIGNQKIMDDITLLVLKRSM
jgi:serine phosphatase RsbU (regulator of sigma subunit)